jgi:hypothetical protein
MTTVRRYLAIPLAVAGIIAIFGGLDWPWWLEWAMVAPWVALSVVEREVILRSGVGYGDVGGGDC